MPPNGGKLQQTDKLGRSVVWLDSNSSVRG